MEAAEKIKQPFYTEAESSNKIEMPTVEANFKPKGAIAFFVLLVILSLVTWFGIYFLMLHRA